MPGACPDSTFCQKTLAPSSSGLGTSPGPRSHTKRSQSQPKKVARIPRNTLGGEHLTAGVVPDEGLAGARRRPTARIAYPRPSAREPSALGPHFWARRLQPVNTSFYIIKTAR